MVRFNIWPRTFFLLFLHNCFVGIWLIRSILRCSVLSYISPLWWCMTGVYDLTQLWFEVLLFIVLSFRKDVKMMLFLLSVFCWAYDSWWCNKLNEHVYLFYVGFWRPYQYVSQMTVSWAGFILVISCSLSIISWFPHVLGSPISGRDNKFVLVAKVDQDYSRYFVF